jgi:hypothetical protein
VQTKVLARKIPLNQMRRGRTDHNRIGWSNTLYLVRNVRWFPESYRFMSVASVQLSYND